MLGTAYLRMVNGEYDKANADLAKAAGGSLSAEERSLEEVLAAVLLIRKAGRLDATTEGELLPRLQRIEKRGETDAAYAKIYRDVMSTVVATAYLQNHDTVKAVYTLGRIEKHDSGYSVSGDYQDLPGTLLERMSTGKLQELQRYYAGSSKTPWDRWLIQGSFYTPSNLKELEGTKYLRGFQWSKAVSVLQQIPGNELQGRAFLSPFVAQIPDQIYPDSNVRVASYTKLQFAKEMQGLQGKTDAASQFRYGCGLYSMSYYGWSNAAFTYYRSTSDELAYYADAKRAGLPAEFQEYYGVMTAERSFKQAAAATSDKELRAKSLWMAAKCWQKRCPTLATVRSWERYNDSTYYLNALTNPYFEQLRQQAANTAFYEDASFRCSYLADYLRSK
jgi:hypothetical protein